jgi:phospholipid/cholesterol/gamma-HCH transport system substrate-binding protein
VRSFRDRNPYAVGLVSVLVIGLLTGVAFAIGLLHLLERAYEMEGVFADASGLRSGDEVKMAGVKVGRVTGIEADRENGNVIVTWVVNDGVHLGPETTAEIALETLLGAKFIRLEGDVEEPYLEDLDADERVIPIERTKIPFDVFELTRIATEGIQELDTAALNSFVNQLADITEDKRASVTDLIEGIDRVSTAIVQRDQQVAELLDRADRLSATLAEKDQTLVALIDQSRQILGLIAERRDQLAVALGEGSDAVSRLARLIEVHEVALDSILDDLHSTLTVVAAHQDDVDAALLPLGYGFYQQSLSGSHGPWLDLYIRSLGPDLIPLFCSITGSEVDACNP